MKDCEHRHVARLGTGHRWACSGCGQGFVSDDPLPMPMHFLFLGKEISYWAGMEDRLRALEGEKFALEMRLAENVH